MRLNRCITPSFADAASGHPVFELVCNYLRQAAVVTIDCRAQRLVIGITGKIQDWQFKLEPTPFSGHDCRIDQV